MATSGQSNDRVQFIDGLRGLAILMVLAYHAWLHAAGTAIPVALLGRTLDLAWLCHLGFVGVHLFLVLSGFCLTYRLARGEMTVDLGRFFRRRAWRILPPYYVALALFILLRLGMGRPAETGDIVTHALMIHNLWPQWMGSINGAFWSLALECQLYLVFPLLLFGFRRLGLAPVLLATLAMTLIYRSWVWTTIDVSELSQAYYWCYSLPGRLFEFVLGMTAAITQARSSAWQTPARQRGYMVGMLAAGALAASMTVGISPFSPVSDVLWGAAFFCLVMYGGARSASGAPILTGRLLVGLGVISYSIYLIHAPLLRLLGTAARSTALPPLLLWIGFELILVPLLIGLGWLFYRLVESRFVGTDTRKPPESGRSARAPVPALPVIARLLPSGFRGRD